MLPRRNDLKAAAGFGQALVGLNNSGLLTQDMFAGIANQIAHTRDALVAQGKDGGAVCDNPNGALTRAIQAQQLAWLMADAILRTLFRLFVSGRRRLEWVTEAQTRSKFDLEIVGLYRRMWGALLLTLLAGVVAAMSGLPPNRPVNANNTDFEGYAPPQNSEEPAENVDYYQTVTLDYLKTMGIPIVKGRGVDSTDVTGASTSTARRRRASSPRSSRSTGCSVASPAALRRRRCARAWRGSSASIRTSG